MLLLFFYVYVCVVGVCVCLLDSCVFICFLCVCVCVLLLVVCVFFIWCSLFLICSYGIVTVFHHLTQVRLRLLIYAPLLKILLLHSFYLFVVICSMAQSKSASLTSLA